MRRHSAGIGVAGAVGADAAGVAGPFSTRSSIEIKNAMPKASTSAQAMNTKRNAMLFATAWLGSAAAIDRAFGKDRRVPEQNGLRLVR